MLAAAKHVDNGTTTGSDGTAVPSQATGGSKTGVIVGVVVGVVGALLLAIAVVWSLRRRARQRRGQLSHEKAPQTTSASSTVGEDSRSQSTSELITPDGPPEPQIGNSEASPAPRRRRVVQEQDAVFGSGYAPPPSYSGDWTPESNSPVNRSQAQSTVQASRTTPIAMLPSGLPGMEAEGEADASRSLPRTPQPVRSGLQEEYKRAFAPDLNPPSHSREKLKSSEIPKKS